MKRILSLALALMLLGSLMTFNVSASTENGTNSYVAAPQISNITYAGSEYDLVSPMAVDGINHRYKDLTTEVFTGIEGVTFSENSYYIRPTYSDYSDSDYIDMNASWLTFDINRTADIYVLTSVTPSSSYLTWMTTTATKFTQVAGATITNESTGSQARRKSSNVWKMASNELALDGSEVQSIVLKGCGGNLGATWGVYGVVVDFGETTPTEELTNITYAGTHGYDVISPMTADGTNRRYTDLSNEVFTGINNVEFSNNSYYIRPAYYDYNNETYNDKTAPWVTFTINKPADIYVLTSVSPGSSYLSWMTAAATKFTQVTDATITNESNGSQTRRKQSNVWKMSVTELPEAGYQEIVLKGCGGNLGSTWGVYGVVVDFGEEKEVHLHNVVYNGKAGSVASPMALGVKRFSDLDGYEFSNFNGYTFGEDSYYIQPAYTAKDYESDACKSTTDEFASFEISKSAHVYILTYITETDSWLPWLDKEGYKAIGTDGVSLVSPRLDYTNKLIIESTGNTTSTTAGRTKAFLYKRTFIVPEGETYRISLKGQGHSSSTHASYGIVVDFTDDDKLVPSELSDINVFSSQSYGTQTIDDVSYSSYSLAFSRALPAYGSIVREGYGLLISKTKATAEELVFGEEDTILIKADDVNHPANEQGQYGVLIYGAGYDCADVYYGRPYAVYGGKIIYGPVVRMDE